MVFTKEQHRALLAEGAVIWSQHKEHRHRLYKWVAEVTLSRRVVAELERRRQAIIFEEWSKTWNQTEES